MPLKKTSVPATPASTGVVPRDVGEERMTPKAQQKRRRWWWDSVWPAYGVAVLLMMKGFEANFWVGLGIGILGLGGASAYALLVHMDRENQRISRQRIDSRLEPPE